MVASTLKRAKRVTIAVIGFSVLALGIAMILLPGPAIVVVPVGLAILATEFVWAKGLLIRVKELVARMKGVTPSRRKDISGD
jgi:uncharacterized protein (TIGR02611 family)